VDRLKVIDGKRITAGDTLLALPSAGLHTNGYSLARKLFFEVAGYDARHHLAALAMTVGEALLAPHTSYLNALAPLLDGGSIKGLAHITGGGLTENIPRILPEGTGVLIKRDTWPVLPIFKVMQELGNVTEAEMYRTFNMGVGMVIVCAQSDKQMIGDDLGARGFPSYEIGRVREGNREVIIS
jgi:phosphoribosylformylglycinamidine cyclo-ligase